MRLICHSLKRRSSLSIMLLISNTALHEIEQVVFRKILFTLEKKTFFFFIDQALIEHLHSELCVKIKY